jgi:hypothetical protein
MAPPNGSDGWSGADTCGSDTNSSLTGSANYAREGSRSMRARVINDCIVPEAVYADGQQQRAEISGAGSSDQELRRYYKGEEHFFGWSMLLAPDFPAGSAFPGFVSFMQMRANVDNQSARLGGNYNSDGSIGVGSWRTMPTKGVWYDFVLRAKFSESSTDGNYSLWVRKPGETVYTQVINNTPQALLFSAADFGYLKLGQYRTVNTPNGTDASFYYDAVRVGDTFNDVIHQ